MKVDIEDGKRQRIAALIAEADNSIENEPDLEGYATIRQHAEAPSIAMALLSEGVGLCAQGRFEEGLDTMRSACAMAAGNTVIRAVLTDTMGERARILMDADMPAAEKLLGELLDLDPNHAVGQNMYVRVLDKKREDFLSSCTGEARRLQVAGDFEGARTVVQQGLGSHPKDPGLNQALAALNGAIQSQAELSAESIRVPTVESPSAIPEPEAKFDQPRNRGRLLIVLGALCALLLGVGAYRLIRGRNPAVALATTVWVDLRTKPPGALLKIDGTVRGSSNLQLDLTAGAHSVTAELEGYQPISATITPNLRERAALDLVLLPIPVTLRVYSEADGAEAWLDEAPLTVIQEGEFLAHPLTWGTHSFRFSNRKGRVSMGLEVAIGKSPAIGVPVETIGVELALVHQYGGRAWVYCNCLPVNVSLDNRPSVKLAPSGIDWTGVTVGPHELRLDDGKSERTFKIQSGPAPSVTAFVFSKAEPDTGVLSVSTGEDNVKVYLNDNLYRRTTQQGNLRIPDLAVTQKYNVRVSKDGYDASPVQSVSLTRGAETRVTFQLKVAARMAALEIKGAQAGARVLVDEKPIGVVAPDGEFLSEVTPGSHSIELRKDTSRSKKVTRSFAEGLNTLIPGPDLILQSSPGSLRFKISPPNSHITIRVQSEQESQARSIGQESVVLPEGLYVVSVNAPGYAESVAAIALPGGGNVLVELALKHIENAPEPSSAGAGAMANWEDPDGWIQDGHWYVHKTGAFVAYRVSPVNGIFTFEAMVVKGKRLQWEVNRTDDKNYILCKLDKKYFERSEIANGKSKEQVKIEHNLADPLSFTLKIDISADQVQHSLMRSGNWVVIDSWSPERSGVNKGKFGFVIPWRDEFAVSSFIFSPQGSVGR